MANTTDSTPGFQRGYYDLEPFSCKSLCGGGEEVQARGRYGAWGEQTLRCTHTVGHPSLCWPWPPPRSVPPWWHLARGCLVQPLHPHQIKAEHMHSAWSKPSGVLGQWQEGRQNGRVGIPCHLQPRSSLPASSREVISFVPSWYWHPRPDSPAAKLPKAI